MEQIFKFPTYVIHLSKKCQERKIFFFNNIKNAGYENINIFEAVDAYDDYMMSETLKIFNYPKIDNSLSKGQIGCLLSHLKLYKYIIDNKIENVNVNVFEDDVYFHPKWNKLSQEYYNNTPKDYDILFIGNQIHNHKSNKINSEPCYCTHAYIITLDGAKKIYDLLLNFGFDFEMNTKILGKKFDGIFVIDIIFYIIQERTNANMINSLFKWYCWNGTYYKCDDNKLPLKGLNVKNSGLVFQSEIFESSIH